MNKPLNLKLHCAECGEETLGLHDRCPKCGTESKHSFHFCAYCGHDFIGVDADEIPKACVCGSSLKN